MSVVSVLLTRSAAPRSRAPTAPMLLPSRLPRCKCYTLAVAKDVWGFLSATATATATATHTHIHIITSQPHLSVVSVTLTCSASPRSRAPAAPMQQYVRLLMCKCEHWPRSWRNCTPPCHIHIPASLQRLERRVDPQCSAHVPRACIADFAAIKADYVHVLALCKLVWDSLCSPHAHKPNTMKHNDAPRPHSDSSPNK
jgi:hypothetical protein